MNRNLQYSRDIIILILLLPIWLPLLVFVLIMTLIRDGRPLFYSQKRIGLHGKPFEIYKIRTMLLNDKLSDDLRITSNGYFLRSWSLDEVPQFLNVIKGDMSLVGPRPLLWTYRMKMSEKILHDRHSVKPGITGLAQINGRNELDWKSRIQFDREYSQSQTFWGDLLILIKTIPILLNRVGIYTKDGKMMPELQNITLIKD